MSPSTSPPLITRIRTAALRDTIDLTTLPFHTEALLSISHLSNSTPGPTPDPTTPTLAFTPASRIDTHTHPIPPWFRALDPHAAGRPTPSWTLPAHLSFMSQHNISHSLLSISTPQANAFPASPAPLRQQQTIALARLLNEYCAEICRLCPERFSWLAVVPLPYVDAAVREAAYARELGACGVGVLTNHEGVYVGDGEFDGLWGYLQERGAREGEGGGTGKGQGKGKEVVFIHPTEPVVRLEDGRLVRCNPSPLRSGLGEFYFETARAMSSITATKAITRFPNLHWRVAHGAGAFPDISDRFLLGFPEVAGEARKAYKERFWYDSAGPVFPNQVKGLTEGMGVPVSQLVFGTDYPYGIGFWDVDANIAGLADAEFLSSKEKEQVFRGNILGLLQEKIARGQEIAARRTEELGLSEVQGQ